MAKKMKDSMIEWIGEIPEEWESKPLKAILNERNENNKPVKTDFILSLTIEKGVIPYNEKGSGGNKAKEDITAYKLAYPNDIVLNSMNVIVGSVGLSKYFGAVSPVYYVLYPKNNNDYVQYYNNIFQSKEFQDGLKGLGNGIMVKQSESSQKLNTIRMRIPMTKLGRVSLPYPPPKEQQTIADYLDQKCGIIDSIIEKQNAVIEKLKTYKQSIITKVVTKGLDHNAKMKPSGIEWIGDIPERWEVKRLRYVARCQNGISKSSEYFGHGYPFVSYGNVYNNTELPISVDGLVDSTEDERRIFSVQKGDIFFTRTSETIEEIGLTSTCVRTIANATFAGFLIRVRPIQQDLFEGFSKYYFGSEIHRLYFVKEMNLVTRASLSQELLKKLPVLLPPFEEQKSIATYLDAKCSEIDNIIFGKQKLIEKLSEYKKSMIYECVTGKREVV